MRSFKYVLFNLIKLCRGIQNLTKSKTLKKYFTLILLLISSFVFSQSDGIPERPNPPRLVNNLSKEMPDFLSQDEEARLEKKLQDFANQTSNQIVIVIVDDLGGMEPWSFATDLGHKWGVGQAKMDNGVVILIKPTGGKGKRKSHISVGYGLEGAIPDLTAKQIIENELNPYLAKGNVYEAFDKSTDVLMALAKGEYNSDAYGKKHSKNKFPMKLIIPLIFLILFIIFRAGKGGRGGNGFTMGATGFMMGSGFGSRGGGFGGGDSGGFGGFGGSGFGGGGAGGDW